MLANDGSGAAALTEHVREGVLGRMVRYGGAEALRCLALACKTLPLADAPVRPNCPGAAGKTDERKRLHVLGVGVSVRRRCLSIWIWLWFGTEGQVRMSVERLGFPCIPTAATRQQHAVSSALVLPCASSTCNKAVAHCACATKHVLGFDVLLCTCLVFFYFTLMSIAIRTACCAAASTINGSFIGDAHALLAEQAPEKPGLRSGGARG